MRGAIDRSNLTAVAVRWPALAWLALVLAVGAGAWSPAAAQEVAAEEVAAEEDRLTFPDLEATADRLFEEGMAEHRVSGGVIAVVYRGEVLLSKGYGLADVAAGVPVDPSRTLFRLGSISKTVNAAAVLQLVEEGKLGLDRDLRGALDVDFPTRHDAPVTLRALLTHTAGYEGSDIGDAARTVDRVVPMRRMVERGMTAQHWRPGALHTYSNHGITLAGYAVEHADGRPFAEAVAARIFEPLGMERSSFAQPLPAALAGDLAVGHRPVEGPAGDGFEALPLDYSNVAPADTLMSTADDMTRFMLALLAGGAVGDGGSEGSGERRILTPASVAEMTSPQFSYVESSPIAGLGLFFERYRGRWAREHTGGQLGFTSHLVLFPEEELGFFFALNTRRGRMRWEVLQGLLERYLPALPDEEPPASIGPLPPAELARYAGEYRRMDYPRETIEKVGALLGFVPTTVIEATDSGTLRVGNAELSALGGGRFWAEPWGLELRFVTERNGPPPAAPAAEGAMQRGFGRDARERIQWWAQGRLHLVLWALAAALFLSYLIAVPIAAWRARRRRRREPAAGGTVTAGPGSGGARWPRRIGVALAAVYTLSLAGFMLAAGEAAGQLDYGFPLTVRLGLWGLDLGALLTFLAVPAAIVYLRRPEPGRLAKGHLAAVTLVAAALTWSLAFWNLVG